MLARASFSSQLAQLNKLTAPFAWLSHQTGPSLHCTGAGIWAHWDASEQKKRTRERLCLKLSSEKELSMSYGEKQAKCEVHDAAAVYVLCSRCCCKRINRPILNTTQMKEVPRIQHQQQQCLLNTLLVFFRIHELQSFGLACCSGLSLEGSVQKRWKI